MASMNIRQTYRRVENKIGLFGSILFGLEILIVFVLVWKIPLNNLRLEHIERNFRALEPYHPEDSELLSEKNYVGALYTGARSCGYFVGEFRVSALSREDIKKAYAGKAVPYFRQRTGLPAQVRFADEGFLDGPWYTWRDELLETPTADTASKNVYSVHVEYDRHSSPFGDFRCFYVK